jgi:hypothetical protein
LAWPPDTAIVYSALDGMRFLLIQVGDQPFFKGELLADTHFFHNEKN